MKVLEKKFSTWQEKGNSPVETDTLHSEQAELSLRV